ncbi:MAG: CPBP family intramembrane metalloprotease [Verrucomicrobia bacterium]|nr:CPBP family intramembrane metalloprotease [Verrucomicrobiota bacterium]
MRPGRVLLIFTVTVFLGGAVLAPWLYWLAQWGATHSTSFESLARNPFHRFVNRALLVLALLGIWPLMRALGMRSWKNLGWVSPKAQGQRIAAGFGIGFASLALVGALALACGAWQWHTDLTTSRFFGKLWGAALSAVVVAILEETFFRGAILGAWRRTHSARAALWLSSAIYALLHFFQRPVSPEQVEWFSGLLILPQMMRGFVDLPTLVPAFFSLLIVGVILGQAYQRTGNLYFSMGLHGGWVFWLKFWGVIAQTQAGGAAWFWGTGKLIDGWLALGVLASVGLVLWRGRWMEERPNDGPRMDNAGS